MTVWRAVRLILPSFMKGFPPQSSSSDYLWRLSWKSHLSDVSKLSIWFHICFIITYFTKQITSNFDLSFLPWLQLLHQSRFIIVPPDATKV